ncbi:SNF2-related protein [Spirochaeta cellobiosiphila]|uniref:SNF2-related protein n=1 Tax=Spirochaeta cellobiosiphila TaxID=504483 RepID=UPI0003FFF9B5|nr:SNF2-related protein [Spirochaeta cellobiosiphila]
MTNYHAKYFAHELVKRSPANSYEKLTNTILDAKVDLNPHQVEAALFAFQSPLGKGAILADEVGLGKTIEAGIIISQNWAERKRKILIILPSNLRKQWSQELMDKFYIPSVILETKSFNAAIKSGNFNPFDTNEIVLCSYHFARNKADYIARTNWDLIVIDEAHRLRNVYKKNNVIANTIKNAVNPYKKILLTATPLQNSLLELYGLVSFIDEYAFGDLKSFKAQYSHLNGDNAFLHLKERLKPVCKRTLRKQVVEYIRYTKRIPMTQEFIPSDDEQQLYEWVSEYLQRPNLNALPAGQRTLMTLVMRKLLSSSTYAIAGALNSIMTKLEKKLKGLSKVQTGDSSWIEEILEEVAEDYEGLSEESDEWEDEEGNLYTEEDIEAIQREIDDLRDFRDLAISITENAKGEKLLTALSSGFQKIEELGGVKKAVIFTESRRTQEYVLQILSETEYEGKIVLFNGSNNDEKSKEVYKNWLEKHKGTDKITGSKTADMRAALVDYFREEAVILIATEAAAEGINLQFCSFIVNYDMPWNPQRIEQRIGRCHRYGQKFDVVVLNFLNRKNAADVRVYELLNDKFRLFEGVFGVSDEVLGAIESGVDFEKQVLAIYQNCRTQDEIKDAFDELQSQFQDSITTEMHNTRQKLLENFDEEVHEKLKVAKERSESLLSTHKQRLFDITKKTLAGYADFEEGGFVLNTVPDAVDATVGRYTLSQDENLGHRYRIGLPLAHYAITQAQNLETSNVEIVLNYTGIPKVSVIEPFIGKSGWMMVKKVTIDSFEIIDEIIVSCICDDGTVVEPDIARRLFSVDGKIVGDVDSAPDAIELNYKSLFKGFTGWLAEENAKFFDEEMTKLDAWADDLKKSLEIEIKQLDVEIKTRKTESRKITELAAKVSEQREIKKLESQRNEKRKFLFTAQDDIEEKKEGLIDNIESRMNQEITETELFTIRWELRG